MKYEIQQSAAPGDWEVNEYDGDENRKAKFSGPDAQERAEAYLGLRLLMKAAIMALAGQGLTPIDYFHLWGKTRRDKSRREKEKRDRDFAIVEENFRKREDAKAAS